MPSATAARSTLYPAEERSSAEYSGRDPLRGLLLSVVGMLLLSCNFITVKYGLDDGGAGFNPETLTVVWMGTATVFSLLWIAGRGQARHIARSGGSLRWLLGIGVTNAFCQLMMWQGLQRLDASFAAFLGRFAPMMAIIMGAIIFQEKIKRPEWLAIAVIVAGGALSTLAPGETVPRAEWIGIALSLGAALFSAAQWPLAKQCGQCVPGAVTNLFRVSVAAILVCLWGVVTSTLDFTQARPDQWFVVCFGAFLGPFLSHILFFRSYHYWDMSRSAMVWTLQPLVVIPLSWLVFHTAVTGWRLIGGLIILAGALALAALHRKGAQEPLEVVAEVEAEENCPADAE